MSRTVTLAVACVLALGLAACGSSSGGGDDASTGTTGGGAPATAAGADAQAAIDRALRGSFALPPGGGPRAQRDKKIWFIPVSSETYDYRRPGSLFDAAGKLGWDVTQFDGRYSPDTIVSGIRQAIADRADGVILYIVDCPNVKAALQEARAAGVKIVAAQGFDCSDVRASEPALFDATVRYAGSGDASKPMPFPDFIRDEWGTAQALAVINGTGGKAKLIDVYESDLLVTVEQDKGVRAGLRRYCPDCEVVDTVEFTGAEIGAPLQQKIEQSLTRHPEANAIISPYDSVTKITAAAVRASGRTGQIYSVGSEGDAEVMDAVRDGGKGVDAGVGLAPDWELHGMLDAMNRLLGGEREGDGFPTGNGTQIIDREHNLPEPGERYAPPLDFRRAYYDAWGVN
ncbi:sugar ABC transporter substrate-binding protein [Conexibacter woesei]|uniref:ABC-type sugar transport system periplasmic component-like protein n=1 Tax=Conexibacter woesei (strain DSM 14684 / CCUG 47730 / CIP 108061 / JCM 11494 / NBRC 100937 / ID131577) TaxID=469383 RepID=D3F3Q6_CONWI|nr:substrate-binding domain-containing protein [Conexibacter woesei]ADB52421.1 ABC-type sugar transport system periplasmic component-like protein [Conexibacter woesei DSM 14684]